MKKLILSALFYTSIMLVSAIELPKETITPPPGEINWLDGFAVRWGYNNLELVNPKGIQVIKNSVEDVSIYKVQLTESQLDYDSPAYEEGQLQIIFSNIEFDLGTYEVIIPEGCVNILIDDEKIPNPALKFEYKIVSSQELTLPEPEIEPFPGSIESIEKVMMVWKMSVVDTYCGLNYNKVLGYNNETGEPYIISEPEPITAYFNDEPIDNVIVSFEWSSKEAETPGWDGDILWIDLGKKYDESGELRIVIPNNYLRISDIDVGTLENEEILLKYTIAEAGISKIISNDINNQIFNLQGIKVDSAVQELGKGLPAGIYIINGKKTIIKR